jgi:hypothetical protein
MSVKRSLRHEFKLVKEARDGILNIHYINCIICTCVVYLTNSCVNLVGPRVPKKPNCHTNELNTTFFCSMSPLKAPNRLKS